MNCLHCHATTDNGLALCQLCQRKATVCLDVLPVYFRNLARWRPPARPNGSLGTSGTWLIKRGDSEGNQIANALARAANDLSTWARGLEDDRGVVPPVDAETESETVEILCAWLGAHLTSVATLEWVGQFVRDVDRHERALRKLTEAAVPGWYAGACGRRIAMATPGDDGICGAPTYVVPGLTWVTCASCGSTTYARDHLDTIADEARGWVARPMRLAEAVVALVDTELSIPRLHKRISKWGERAQIEAVDRLGYGRELNYAGEQYAPKRYRFGDVLDRLIAEGATREDDLERTSGAAS
jgi:hypothetical protein